MPDFVAPRMMLMGSAVQASQRGAMYGLKRSEPATAFNLPTVYAFFHPLDSMTYLSAQLWQDYGLDQSNPPAEIEVWIRCWKWPSHEQHRLLIDTSQVTCSHAFPAFVMLIGYPAVVNNFTGLPKNFVGHASATKHPLLNLRKKHFSMNCKSWP